MFLCTGKEGGQGFFMCTGFLKSLETKLEIEPFSELFQVHSDMLKVSNPLHPVIFIDTESNTELKPYYSR